ncbi:FG-GAP-like repeat-containing protein [Candidatus Cloacimonadota bacterium]
MDRIIVIVIFSFILVLPPLYAQPWQQNDEIFNTSGVPSLSFSQPRFADLDNDGDMDMILGNIYDAPLYMENTGSGTSPGFSPGDDLFSEISSLDAEIGVCVDLDGDSDLDLIAGGYTGLNYFENIGTLTTPEFQLIQNYFSNITSGQNPVPDLADIDDDGDLDLVLGFSENGNVKIFINSGTLYNAEFLEANSIYLGDVGLYAYPNFCDLDADNDQDIVVGRDAHGFIYYQNNGSPQVGSWAQNNTVFSGIGNDSYWNSPGITDINGDGTFDLIFGTSAGPLQFFENSGTVNSPVWQENTSLFGGVIDVGGASNPFFYDFDDDEDLDMISGSQLGEIKYFENTGNVYAPAWQENSTYFSSIDHSIYTAVTLGDVNNDGLADAIIGDLSGNFYYHQNNGDGFSFISDVLSFVNLGGWSCPRLIDMDDDGDLDIVAGNEAGNLYYFENQGTVSAPEWVEIDDYFEDIDVGSNCVPTIGDIDLNNNLDLLTGDLWGETQYYTNFHGSWLEDPSVVEGITGNQNVAPALADLDNDGDLDLTLGDYDGTFSYYVNLLYNVDSEYELMPIVETKLYNYPNPFNPTTTISFELTAEDADTARLDIYNLKGQRIITFDTFPQVNPGSTQKYSVFWDGRDINNQPVSSGVYLSCLYLGDIKVTRKMVLMK